jgi:hypothetical protein
MPDQLTDLYTSSGAYADPILFITVGLLIVGSVMMFVVRLIKQFVLYTIVALVLPNTVGVIGYIDSVQSAQEVIVERGEELGDDVAEAVDDALEDNEFSPLMLGFIGSGITACLGIAGVVSRSRKSRAGTNPEGK